MTPALPPTRDSWTMALLLAFAAALTGTAVEIGNGGPDALAMAIVTLAIGVAAIALLSVPIARIESAGERLLSIVVAVTLVLHAGMSLVRAPTPTPDAETSLPFVALWTPAAVLAALLLPAMFCASRTWRRVQCGAFALLLAVHLAMGFWVVRAVPFTVMDLFIMQTESCEAALRGLNPYAITITDLSFGTATTFAPGIQQNGRLMVGFPYPPLSLLMALPGYLLANDVRYAHAVCLTLAGALIGFSSRNRWAIPIAAAILLSPRALEIIEKSWTEPFAILLLAGVAISVRRARWAAPMLLGLLLVVKQYMILATPLILLLIPRPLTRRRVSRWAWQVGLAAAAVTLPLALIDPGAFVHSAILFQLRQPFRPDAMTYPAVIAKWTGIIVPSSVLSLLAIGTAELLVLRRAPRTIAGFCGALGLCLLVFFPLSRQAFVNYYFLVIAAFLAAVATATINDDAASPSR